MKEKKKITFQEYKEKYTKFENPTNVKTILFIVIAALGIIVAVALALLTLRLFDINNIAGYIGIGVSVLLFALLYVLPILKIFAKKAFITNVNERTASSAKRHNKKLRNEIADMMIDYNESVDGASWYNEELVNELIDARHNNNDLEVKRLLSDIYGGDVKKQANKIIRNTALKVVLLTALSQSDKVDTILVIAYELIMIKDIIYLYGFRPSDTKLLKIYLTVLRNALIAYGASNVSTNLVTNAANAIAEALGTRTALGSLISTIVGGATSGVINGTLSVIIGFQTRKYLLKEYNLQNILDNVEINEEEEEKMLSQVKSDIIKASKKKKKIEIEGA